MNELDLCELNKHELDILVLEYRGDKPLPPTHTPRGLAGYGDGYDGDEQFLWTESKGKYWYCSKNGKLKRMGNSI